jgi:transposase
VEVSGADRAELEHWLRAQSIPQALATRARIVLGSAAGESVRGLAARLGVTETTVCLWRRRYRSAGLNGLRTKPRMGRPRRITSAKEQAVISATLRKPKAATHWSALRLAQQVGLAPGHRPSHLAEVWAPAAPGRNLQVQLRPAVRRQAGRYRWALSGPAGARAGAVRGRKVADSGA